MLNSRTQSRKAARTQREPFRLVGVCSGDLCALAPLRLRVLLLHPFDLAEHLPPGNRCGGRECGSQQKYLHRWQRNHSAFPATLGSDFIMLRSFIKTGEHGSRLLRDHGYFVIFSCKLAD